MKNHFSKKINLFKEKIQKILGLRLGFRECVGFRFSYLSLMVIIQFFLYKLEILLKAKIS